MNLIVEARLVVPARPLQKRTEMNAIEVLKEVKNDKYSCLQKGSDTKGTILFIYLNGVHVVVDQVAAAKYWNPGPKKQVTLAEMKKLKLKVPKGMKLHSFKTKKEAKEFYNELVDEKLDTGFEEFTPH